jgi:hypothetical protein
MKLKPLKRMIIAWNKHSDEEEEAYLKEDVKSAVELLVDDILHKEGLDISKYAEKDFPDLYKEDSDENTKEC